MKKTLIAFLALCGVATANSTILTFQTSELSYATDQWALDGVGGGQGHKWEGSKSLSDDTVAKLTLNTGKFWDSATLTTSWTNMTALSAMNSDLGTSLTADKLTTTSIKFDASAAGGAVSTLTLDFSANSAYQSGQNIVFYLLVAARQTAYNNFSVTGLADSTISWASAAGDGFNADITSISVPVDNLAMIKVTGTLTDSAVEFKSTSARNGWALVAYNTPEPATATLSLLALAGLAARRRRH